MAIKKWEKLSEEVLSTNPYSEYRMAKYRIPSGKVIDYYYVHSAGASMVVAVNREGKIAMVNQYRAVIDKESLEFPAGKRQQGKDDRETALAELAEETQFAAKEIEQIGTIEVSPGLVDLLGYIFIAHDLYPSETEADETEEFEVFWYSPEEIEAMIANGKIANAWTLASWMLSKKRIVEIIAKQK